METFTLEIQKLIFHNNENCYTIASCGSGTKVVGYIAEPEEGMMTEIEGQWEEDPKFGRQIRAKTWLKAIPTTLDGIKNYLASGAINGIGKQYADRIVEKFGKDTIDVIENKPERLLEIPGIGKKRLEQIKEGWASENELRNIMIFLQSFGVSISLVHKIHNKYGKNTIAVMKENPYRIADEILGIGFKTADRIALKMGIAKDSLLRLKSGLRFTLQEMTQDGHCYAEEYQLIEKAEKILEAGVEEALAQSIEDGTVIQEDGKIYLPSIYYCEKRTASRLAYLSEFSEEYEMPVIRGPIQYDDIQIQAIQGALKNKVFYITGGPGTGKTTITNAIIDCFEQQGMEVLLAAPTGRAAKRMSEATGHEAKTIHRTLEFSRDETFARNEQNPLEGDVLIVDECSMIDIYLLDALMKAVPKYMHLVLIGDADQLPSVGPGTVLRDIISSGVIPGVRLEHIYRQAEQSRIITNAHKINKGEMPDLSNGKTDFFFVESTDADVLVKFATENLPQYYNVDPKEIQVLAPMKNGSCGVRALNKKLQEKLNPTGKQIARGDIVFREKDKVMQLKNNYEKGVFNGDIGYIAKIDDYVAVWFDDQIVTYKTSELDELTLAYATTVHKSQGSEYKIVAMAFSEQAYVMLNRNLLYTAVTRAKDVFVMFGTKKAIKIAIHKPGADRNTTLKERLRP